MTTGSLSCTIAIVAVISFSACKDITPPALTTKSITDIKAISATGGGEIIDDGGEAPTVCGLCWSSTGEPSLSDEQTSENPSSGSFFSNMNDLNGGTKYFVRAYATNSAGTGYGAVMSFTTLGQAPIASTLQATEISTVGAVLNGSVNANFMETAVTFEYGPTASYGFSINAAQNPITGNSNTNVSAGLTGLSPGTTYHFRVRSVNSLGTSIGNDKTFNTRGQVPSATTQPVKNVTITGATLPGTVNANELSTSVSFEYGLTTSYGTSILSNPSTVTGNTNTNVFADIIGLIEGTTYHYRIIAINSLGTTYSSDFLFETYRADAIKDFEGNYYNVISIGTQTWMANDLKSVTYSDGTSITGVYAFNNDEANVSIYGRLYTWNAAMNGSTVEKVQGVCPVGWHVPSNNDWVVLEEFLGGYTIAGGKMKEIGTTHWADPNTGATNESSFNALPAGMWFNNSFIGKGQYVFYWGSSYRMDEFHAAYRNISFQNRALYNCCTNPEKTDALSVRCIKD